ncbi:MAG TPA: hydroxyacylglutathione hydrolase, partial [Deltaproteobacteria bacterium]|nr:hydroxyacylglutathione hydrolase [Deltaproteobacteria bacterium]
MIPVPVLQDNYSYLIVPPDEAIAAVVDCVEVAPV